jgi:hypothetical protein
MAALLFTAAAMWLLLRALLPGVFGTGASGGAAPGGAASIRAAVDAGVVAATAGAVIGLVPVAAMARGGVMATVWGYFIGAGGRVVVALAALVLASRSGHLAIEVVTVGLLATYLPLLAVEAGFVGRYLWRLEAARGMPSVLVLGASVKGSG